MAKENLRSEPDIIISILNDLVDPNTSDIDIITDESDTEENVADCVGEEDNSLYDFLSEVGKYDLQTIGKNLRDDSSNSSDCTEDRMKCKETFVDQNDFVMNNSGLGLGLQPPELVADLEPTVELDVCVQLTESDVVQEPAELVIGLQPTELEVGPEQLSTGKPTFDLSKKTQKRGRPKGKAKSKTQTSGSGRPTKKSKEPPIAWVANKDNELTSNVPQFKGILTYNLSEATVKSPLYYFQNLLPDTLLDTIARETTRYAIESGDHSFTTSGQEMLLFLSINMLMTIFRFPSYRMYWTGNDLERLPIIADAMSLKRFEKLKKYIHFIDNETIPTNNRDIFVKLRPVINSLNEVFQQVASATENIAFDEMIIPFKGRSRAKQYLKNKPKKWGFKVWVIASTDGYVSRFELYQGAAMNDVQPSSLGPTADTIVRMCKGLEKLNHKLFLDNLFTTYDLLQVLKKKQIYVIGTLRSNRMKGANNYLSSVEDLTRRGRGSASVTTSSDNITVTRWIDNKAVHMISTYAGKEPMDTAERFDNSSKQVIRIPRPYSISEYNKFMGGVDMTDRMVAHYPHAFKNKKFYLRIFFHLLNVSIVNAWVVFRHVEKSKMPLIDFKLDICRAIFETSKLRKKRGRPSLEKTEPVVKRRARQGCSDDLRMDGNGHFPEKRDLTNALRCRDKHCTKRTRYFCERCEVPLCPECMKKFHS